jgi:tight adherence protein B
MNGTSPVLLVAVATAIGVLALAIGLYVLIDRRRLASERALRERLGAITMVSESAGTGVLRGAAPSGAIDKLLASRPVSGVITEELRRGGLEWSVGEFVVYVFAGLASGVIAGFFVSTTVAIAIGVAGSLAPFAVLAIARRRRERRMEEQLPDAIDMLVNALRAGYSLQAGMHFVGSEMPAPLGAAFSRFHDETRLGMDPRQALENLQQRIGTLDGRMLVLALIVQRETGGNLAEILGNIALVVRERLEFRGKVDVMTSESRLSATVLSLLPPFMFLVISFINPGYVDSLTATEAGQLMIWYAIVSLGIGTVLLRRLARVEA